MPGYEETTISTMGSNCAASAANSKVGNRTHPLRNTVEKNTRQTFEARTTHMVTHRWETIGPASKHREAIVADSTATAASKIRRRRSTAQTGTGHHTVRKGKKNHDVQKDIIGEEEEHDAKKKKNQGNRSCKSTRAVSYR